MMMVDLESKNHNAERLLPLILASGSPRRRELIQLLGIPFEVQVSEVDESQVVEGTPIGSVLKKAQLKAQAVASQTRRATIVLGVDTTVAIAGKILDKPSDEAEARVMLRQLRGQVHQVYTGVVLIHTGTGEILTDVAGTDVPMRNYSDEEIADYMATGDPMDKAGGYAIQHAGFAPVSHLTGCYASVVGLPLCHLALPLARWGVQVSRNVADHCQSRHQYECPIHQQVWARVKQG